MWTFRISLEKHPVKVNRSLQNSPLIHTLSASYMLCSVWLKRLGTDSIFVQELRQTLKKIVNRFGIYVIKYTDIIEYNEINDKKGTLGREWSLNIGQDWISSCLSKFYSVLSFLGQYTLIGFREDGCVVSDTSSHWPWTWNICHIAIMSVQVCI